MALAYSHTSLGSDIDAGAHRTKIRVSRRSNATTGSSKAMYSMVLFIVDRSFSGFKRVGRQSGVRGGQDPRDQLVRCPAGEFHVAGQAQLVAQRDQVVKAIPGSDQRERDVVAVQFVHDHVGSPDDVVHAVLRPHDADVGGEEPAPPAQLGVGRAASQPLRIGPGAHDGDVLGNLPLRVSARMPVGVVGRDHMVRGPVRPALQGAQHPVGQPRAAREARLVKLGTQVVVVEHEPGPVDGAQGQGDRPKDIRWVAGLNHVEPPGPPGPQWSAGPWRGMNRHTRRGSRTYCRRAHNPGTCAALCRSRPHTGGRHRPWGHDRDLMALGGERLALEPYPPVEGHREVLDDDEDAAHRPGPSQPGRTVSRVMTPKWAGGDEAIARIAATPEARPFAAPFIASPDRARPARPPTREVPRS